MDYAREQDWGPEKEAALVRLAKQGDTEAFGCLVEKYKRQVNPF